MGQRNYACDNFWYERMEREKGGEEDLKIRAMKQEERRGREEEDRST